MDNGFLSEEQAQDLEAVKENFDIRVPKIFLDKIKKDSSVLEKQFIPSTNELIFLPEELEDPIGDERWTPIEGITHRYPDRVLFKPTYMCASYCRFCFRRYKVSNLAHNLKPESFNAAIQYIKSKPEIWEVILTGGDPLTLTDYLLQKLVQEISCIEHVKVIRFHTRIPSVLPSRINEKLIQILKNTNKSIWIAAHINSSEEFTEEAKYALKQLIDNGIPVVLQSVMLKNINDSHEQLVLLLKTAVANRVKPYYLHFPDLAKGTEHFRVPLKKQSPLLKAYVGKFRECVYHIL